MICASILSSNDVVHTYCKCCPDLHRANKVSLTLRKSSSIHIFVNSQTQVRLLHCDELSRLIHKAANSSSHLYTILIGTDCVHYSSTETKSLTTTICSRMHTAAKLIIQLISSACSPAQNVCLSIDVVFSPAHKRSSHDEVTRENTIYAHAQSICEFTNNIHHPK